MYDQLKDRTRGSGRSRGWRPPVVHPRSLKALAERVPPAEGGRPAMANVELQLVVDLAAFLAGVVSGALLIIVAGIHAEEKVARKRNLARQRRATTLYDEPTDTMTRGVRRITTGRDQVS
jgi:hypothetical protein